MNFTSIINGFTNYLQELNEISGRNYNTDASSSVSIFMYSGEFKNYISDELQVDSSIFSKSVNDILKMDIVDGKLVDPEEETTEIDEETAADETTTAETETTTAAEVLEEASTAETTSTEENAAAETVETEEETSFVDIINELFEQEDVKNTIDTDGSGDLDEQEIQDFLEAIKDFDGNGEDISLDDLISAYDAIQDGTFTFGDEETTVEEETAVEEDITTDETEAATSTTSTNTSSTSSSSGNYGTTTSSTSSTASVEKTLDNMSESELNTELGTAQTDLSDKQAVLSSILDGSNSELQALQETIDETYSSYLEQLENVDEELAGQVDDLTTQINDKQAEIDAKDQEISDQECAVSDAETAYNNAVTTRETLESSLSALKSIDTSDMESDEKSELSSKISELNSKITEAQEAETEALDAWNEAQETLDTLEEEKTTLESELEELNEQMTELEAVICEQYPQIEEYLTAYNEAKEDYTETKETLKTQAQSDVVEAQEYVNEVQTAINNYDNKQLTNEYCLNSFGEEIVEYAKQFLGYNEADGSADIFLNGSSSSATPWCAAFVTYVLAQNGVDTGGTWSVSGLKSWAESNGTFVSKSEANTDTVKVGDVVIWKENGRSHTGIVTSISDDGTYTTIEGNSSDQVKERTYNINTDDTLTGFISI